MKLKLHKTLLVLLLFVSFSSYSQEAILGEIRMFAGTFAPTGWALCEGQLLSIASNTALFSLLGTTYGGDGETTFGLPDLRGRVPMGVGNGPGLTSRQQGLKTGDESTTLTVSNLPSHSHTIAASTEPGTTADPDGAVLAHTNSFDMEYTTSPNVSMSPSMVGSTGQNQSVNNMQPSLAVRFIIATTGIYPSR